MTDTEWHSPARKTKTAKPVAETKHEPNVIDLTCIPDKVVSLRRSDWRRKKEKQTDTDNTKKAE